MSTDFGNLSQARQFVAGMTLILEDCLVIGFSPTLRDTIDFIEIASTGNAVDFGNLVTADRKECLVLVLQRVFMTEDLSQIQQSYKVFK